MLDTPEAKKIFKACHRFLTHDYPKSPRQVLSELVEMTDPELEADRYGQGEVITRFEGEVAALLGKEAAVFMPSGTGSTPRNIECCFSSEEPPGDT